MKKQVDLPDCSLSLLKKLQYQRLETLNYQVHQVLFFSPAAVEITPRQYILESLVDGNCAIDDNQYSMCNESSLLLDSVHGPQPFSDSALERYYTRIEDGGRILFQFPANVSLAIIQVYYYVRVSDSSRRVKLFFYDVDESYSHPRVIIPQSANTLPSSGFLDKEQFKSVCTEIGSSVRNLLLAAPRRVTLYISEVNFFNSAVTEEVCDGIFMPVPTTQFPPTTQLPPTTVATTARETKDTTATSQPETTTEGLVTDVASPPLTEDLMPDQGMEKWAGQSEICYYCTTYSKFLALI